MSAIVSSKSHRASAGRKYRATFRAQRIWLYRAAPEWPKGWRHDPKSPILGPFMGITGHSLLTARHLLSRRCRDELFLRIRRMLPPNPLLFGETIMAGKIDEVKDRVKDAANATASKAEQAAGKVKQVAEKAADKTKDAVKKARG